MAPSSPGNQPGGHGGWGKQELGHKEPEGPALEIRGWFGIKGTSKISLPPRATDGDGAVPRVSEVSPCPTRRVPAPVGAGIAPTPPGRVLGRAGGVRGGGGGVVGWLLGCSLLTISPPSPGEQHQGVRGAPGGPVPAAGLPRFHPDHQQNVSPGGSRGTGGCSWGVHSSPDPQKKVQGWGGSDPRSCSRPLGAGSCRARRVLEPGARP